MTKFRDAKIEILKDETLSKNWYHLRNVTFNYTGSGPWPAHMRVQSGKSCGSRSWSTGGIFKGLYLTSGARHGRVTLVFSGTYRYFPSPGYVVTTDLL